MMNKLFTLLAVLVVFQTAQAQQKLCIAFYNQENLFDTIDDKHKNDNEFLPTAKKQWDTQKYFNKLNHMATVISSMNNQKGPDVIGMCEVENKAVLEDMTKTDLLKSGKYTVVHFEGQTNVVLTTR